MSFKQGHALLIGVGTHQHHSRLDVPITVTDAQAVQQVLEDSNLCGYQSNKVRLLKETSATKDDILDALDNLSQMQPTDTVFLFFAGHGSMGTDGSYCLLSHDVQLSGGRVKAGTGISEFELLQRLNAIPAKRLFMVFNACHSGLIAPDTLAAEKDEIPETLNPTGNTANALLGTGEGRILIVASRDEQYSYIGEGQTTIFTKALTDGLKGEAGNNGGTISAFGLYEYVYHEVKETVADNYGLVQEPMLTVIRGVGPFPVALYRGASTLGDFSDDREILAETATEEVSQSKAERSFKRIISTGSGAFVGGNVDTGGGDFTGRDKTVHGDEVRGDKIMGDKVGGDKISVGDVSGSSIAIGAGASASVTTGDTYYQNYPAKDPREDYEIAVNWEAKSKPSMQDFDLSNRDLSRQNLEGAILAKADLRGADLYRTILRYADLREAVLVGADLRKANLYYAQMIETDLREAILDGAELDQADLTKAKLNNLNFNGVTLYESKLFEADLSGADLRGAHMDWGTPAEPRLKWAKYTVDTKWPAGVDPKATGAILVDEEGNPIGIDKNG